MAKTLKLKASETPVAEAPIPIAAQMAEREGAVADDSVYKGALIVAILTLVALGAILALQGLEWAYYGSPPSVWPMR